MLFTSWVDNTKLKIAVSQVEKIDGGIPRVKIAFFENEYGRGIVDFILDFEQAYELLVALSQTCEDIDRAHRDPWNEEPLI